MNLTNLFSDLLHNSQQQADNDREEGNTFDQSRGNNHVGTDVSTNFRLTGKGFQRASTDISNTYTCANGSDTCTDTGTHFT